MTLLSGYLPKDDGVGDPGLVLVGDHPTPFSASGVGPITQKVNREQGQSDTGPRSFACSHDEHFLSSYQKRSPSRPSHAPPWQLDPNTTFARARRTGRLQRPRVASSAPWRGTVGPWSRRWHVLEPRFSDAPELIGAAAGGCSHERYRFAVDDLEDGSRVLAR
jgi:hypothetical protein